jgi:hypothetical protein
MIPWLDDIFNVCVSPAGLNHNQSLGPQGLPGCYDMEVGENRVRVFYGIERRERERLEIYTGGISPCSRDRVSDL